MINEKVYSKAMAEVLYILDNTDEEIVSKIPEGVKEQINCQADQKYKNQLEAKLNANEIELSEEAKAVIAVLYRDYICDNVEKEEFNKYMNEKARKIEKEKETKYPSNKVFKNEVNVEYNNEIIEYKKENFIQRIISKLKKFIRS